MGPNGNMRAEGSRRDFLSRFVAGSLTAIASVTRWDAVAAQAVETVSGPVAADMLGITLMHEHVLVDFAGADKIQKGQYGPDEAFEAALPHVRKAYGLGCRTLVECTPAFLGRDPGLLRRLVSGSGLNLVTNTGYYGTGANKYLPRHAFTENAGQLAARWVEEVREGIDGTGIKPAFIKIGVDKGSLSEVHRKLVHAACIAHKSSGLTIASHTGDGVAAMEQLDILRQEGVSAEAFIWVHAQNEADTGLHLKAADAGAWVEFDGISGRSVERHVALVTHMISRRLLGRTLVSMDAGWYHVGEPGGGSYRGYEAVFELFLPALRTAGVTERQIQTLLVENPRHALEKQIHRL